MSSFSSADMPGHRLVEEHELRVLDERPSELDPLLDPVGQIGHVGVAMAREVEEVDDLLDALALRLLLPDGSREEEHAPEDPGLAVQVAADHQVLEHGHAPEKGEVLERAADAEPAPPVGAHARDVGRLRS